MKKSNEIELVKRNGVYVQKNVRVHDKSRDVKLSRSNDASLPKARPVTQNREKQLGDILSGIVVDFFKTIRREMFK
jgi:hypothetical protein